jgi:hypothetical protein
VEFGNGECLLEVVDTVVEWEGVAGIYLHDSEGFLFGTKPCVAYSHLQFCVTVL